MTNYDCACRQASPRESGAERYSLMRKLTVTEPNAETLELCFVMAECEGAPQIREPLKRRQKQLHRLLRLTITPCNATDLKVKLCAIPWSHIGISISSGTARQALNVFVINLVDHTDRR